MAGADVVENKGGDVNLYTDVATFNVHLATRHVVGFCWGAMTMELIISSRKAA